MVLVPGELGSKLAESELRCINTSKHLSQTMVESEAMKNKVQEAEIGAQEATTSSIRLEIKLAEVTANLREETRKKLAGGHKYRDDEANSGG